MVKVICDDGEDQCQRAAPDRAAKDGPIPPRVSHAQAGQQEQRRDHDKRDVVGVPADMLQQAAGLREAIFHRPLQQEKKHEAHGQENIRPAM